MFNVFCGYPSFMTHSFRLAARGLAGALVSLALVAPASAALFTDVPDGSLYQGAVEGLTLQAIVNGYADGSYGPRKPVNRAEFLQLLFRAARLKESDDRLCFSDVPANAWFEAAVCTAKEMGIVGGYPDGTFKPAQEVTRGEAAKMLSMAFQLPGADSLAMGKYTDVPSDRWDAPYIALLIQRGVLPLSGQESATAFHSDWALTRGDAALLLWSTLQSLQRLPLPSSSSSSQSSSVSTSSVSSSTSSRSSSSVSSSSSAVSSSSTGPTIANVTVPFSMAGTVTRREAAVYRFTLSSATTVSVTVKKGPNSIETPACRLFRLGKDGISNEYYLGTLSAGSCLIKVSLAAADYQLEVSAETETGFTVDTTTVKGDGNDGFREAVLLKTGTPARGVLGDADFGQYYKFTVTEEKGKALTVELISNTLMLGCLIFPGDDVDLASFSGPTCNSEYVFPKGSYIVWVGHPEGDLSRASFSLGLR